MIHINCYDEFNIYTNKSDIETYIEKVIDSGIDDKEEVYEKCISHFGNDLKELIDSIFN